MTSGNYQRKFKVLGKLAKLYDLAAADVTTLNLLLAVFADQVADGTATSLPDTLLFSTYIPQWSSAVSSGATALKSLAVSAASAHLISSDFTGDFVSNTPSSPITPATVITALIAELTTNSSTLTTLAATGLVNFLNVVYGSVQTFPTAADGSATYKDSVYVVATIV